MDDKLNKFKELAIEQGHNEQDINAFLEAQKAFSASKPVEDIVEPVGLQAPQGSEGTILRNFIPVGATLPGGNAQDFNVDTQVSPTMTAGKFKVGTPFGARQAADVFSGGINNGVDILTPFNTAVAAPEGNWEVVEAFSNANPKGGFINNGVNGGWGNSILIKNRMTGETIRFSHLNKVGVRPGEILKGGETIASSGNSGNSSGPHLDVEYKNTRGQLSDVLASKYKDSFLTFMSSQ